MAEAANLLRHQTSPYLLQHADNPVHWRPWGPDALAEAAETDKPILLSIGYAACHWCHVMAHESFEDPDTAALMNTLFFRPRGTPRHRPPLHVRLARPGRTRRLAADHVPRPRRRTVLGRHLFPAHAALGPPIVPPGAARHRRRLARARHHGDAERRRAAADAGAAIRRAGRRPADAHASRRGRRRPAAHHRPRARRHQGRAEIPQPADLPLPVAERFSRSGAPEGQQALHLLLQRMSQGGIYDHLGGGYARYATDAIWLVPHFEKMLYDNAQILELLAFAHAHSPDPLYAARAAETVAWITRDMTAAEIDGRAAFAASEDADSEGEEGRFYVWTETEIDTLLGPDAPAFKRAYDVTPQGNWEGHTILRRITPPGSQAEETTLAHCRVTLFTARAKRIRPGRDDKVLADWNGLAIAALARAAAVFAQPAWLERAVAAYDFILANMTAPDGRAQHAWRLGRVTAAGLLDDQSAMARAALALHESTGAARHLAEAIRFANAAIKFFADGQGGFYTSAADATDVPLARPRTAHDNATPAANGLLAEVFARLWHLTGEPTWRERAEALLRAFTGNDDHLAQMPTLLAAADLLEAAAVVVVVGGDTSPPPLEGGGRGEAVAPGSPQYFPSPRPSPQPTSSTAGGASLLRRRPDNPPRPRHDRASSAGNRRAPPCRVPPTARTARDPPPTRVPAATSVHLPGNRPRNPGEDVACQIHSPTDTHARSRTHEAPRLPQERPPPETVAATSLGAPAIAQSAALDAALRSAGQPRQPRPRSGPPRRWQSTTATCQSGTLALYGIDNTGVGQPQMIAGHELSDDKLEAWTFTLT